MKQRPQTTQRESAMSRRIALSMLCALLVVLIGSRVNRPVPLEILEGRARVGDEVLPEVRIDMHSLRSAIASIQKSAKGKIVIDEDGLAEDDDLDDLAANWPELRLRNVRLATALSIALEEFRDDATEVIREDKSEFVVTAAGKRWRPVYVRNYDISDLVEIARKAYQPPRPIVPSNLCFNIPSNSSINHSIEEIFTECVMPIPWPDVEWSAHAWGNQLIVNAGLEGHRSVEEMLLLLRRECASAGLQQRQNP